MQNQETGQSNPKGEKRISLQFPLKKNYAKQPSHFLASFSHSKFLRRFAMDKRLKFHTAKAPKNENKDLIQPQFAI